MFFHTESKFQGTKEEMEKWGPSSWRGLSWGLSGKESACHAGDTGSISGSGRCPQRRKKQPTPVFLPAKSHRQRSLVGYSPWGHKESDMTERLHSLTPKRLHTKGSINKTTGEIIKTWKILAAERFLSPVTHHTKPPRPKRPQLAQLQSKRWPEL